MNVRVEVSASEAVVEHGVAKWTWWVYDGRGWCSVRDYPGATLTRVDAGPSMIWETRAELEVQEGTWFMRVHTRPLPRQHQDPMRYLRGEQLRSRLVRRVSYFVAGRRGELVPARADQAPDAGEWSPPRERDDT